MARGQGLWNSYGGNGVNKLKQRQSYPLDLKIAMTKKRITEFYDHFDGQVYVSFSGGKDSTVLLHIARELYPCIDVVFCDTGLEYPEIRDFVKTINNVTWIKPKITFKEVIQKYGYPIISKEQSQFIDEYRNTNSEKLKDIRYNGNKWNRGKISNKWRYIVDSPFKVSHKCCNVLKKNPFKKYEKDTGKKPIIGTMANESALRTSQFKKDGCNAFNTKRPVSKPMSFWTDSDVWEYIKTKEIKYSNIYDMGYCRTGCMFCMYGLHMDEEPNRFNIMKETHPKQYEYCMKKLGIEDVLEWYPVKKEDENE